MHPNSRFNRWLAPVVGALVGAASGARAMFQPGQPLNPVFPAIGALIGLLAGSLLLLVDRGPREVTVWEEHELGLPAGTLIPREGSNVGRAVFVVLLLLFWFPPTGVPLAVLSLVLNRNWTGGARVVNLMVAGLALCLGLFLAISLLMGHAT